MKEEAHIIISGRVQGVFFRDYTRKKAEKLGLRGFVRNLEEGNVEVVAQGQRNALENFIEKLKKGSLPSKVEKVNVEWREKTKEFNNFSVLRSI